MPEAESAVTAALGKQLPQQVLPVLQDYVHTATIQGKPDDLQGAGRAAVARRDPTTVLTPVPPPPKPQDARAGKARQGQGRGSKVEPVPAVNGAFTLGTVAAAREPRCAARPAA